MCAGIPLVEFIIQHSQITGYFQYRQMLWISLLCPFWKTSKSRIVLAPLYMTTPVMRLRSRRGYAVRGGRRRSWTVGEPPGGSVTDLCCPLIVQTERRFESRCNDVRRRAARADHRRGLGRDQVQDGRWHCQPWVWRLSDGGVESLTRASTLLSHACHVLGRAEQRGTGDPGALALCNIRPLETSFKCIAVSPVHVFKDCTLFSVL